MNHKSNNLKCFIKEFDFANPVLEDLPMNFPDCKTGNLSRQDKWLLEAIKTIWINEGEGKRIVYEKAVKTGVITFAIIFIGLISLIGLTSLSSDEQFAKPVNAATVSASLKQVSLHAGDLIQSTMSAIFK